MFDNAAPERFNSTLEFELLSRRRFATKAAARREVARFIDRYNRVRRHSTRDMKSPVDYEAILAAPLYKGPRRRKPGEAHPSGSLSGSQTGRLALGCRAMTSSVNYPEASTLWGKSRSITGGKGGPMLLAGLSSGGPMLVAGDSSYADAPTTGSRPDE